jgi:23S rRNA pseudouridine2605 synthase
MRINKYIAAATGMSRRAADAAIADGRVRLNGQLIQLGDQVGENDQLTLDGKPITAPTKTVTILMNKPVGYVVSRNGQGAATIYELLPKEYHTLKPVGRLDKDSSGLLLLTNDGNFANELTHPRYAKTKIYEVTLDKPLAPLHQQMISDHGVSLDDGPSRLQIEKLDDVGQRLRITMQQGRNRQIRRTFEALGYKVATLHRTHFGPYALSQLAATQLFIIVS